MSRAQELFGMMASPSFDRMIHQLLPPGMLTYHNGAVLEAAVGSIDQSNECAMSLIIAGIDGQYQLSSQN